MSTLCWTGIRRPLPTPSTPLLLSSLSPPPPPPNGSACLTVSFRIPDGPPASSILLETLSPTLSPSFEAAFSASDFGPCAIVPSASPLISLPIPLAAIGARAAAPAPAASPRTPDIGLRDPLWPLDPLPFERPSPIPFRASSMAVPRICRAESLPNSCPILPFVFLAIAAPPFQYGVAFAVPWCGLSTRCAPPETGGLAKPCTGGGEGVARGAHERLWKCVTMAVTTRKTKRMVSPSPSRAVLKLTSRLIRRTIAQHLPAPREALQTLAERSAQTIAEHSGE